MRRQVVCRNLYDNPQDRRRRGEEDEVEEMLRAAQDELLLKLTVDSHMSRVAPDYLLPDLDHRFQALKSRLSPSQSVKSQPPPPPPRLPDNTTAPSQGDPDDLFARFAALKGSSSSSTSTPATGSDDQGLDNADEEDEVEKIIRWAKDAARLDPSPPSDDEEEKEDDDDDIDEDGQVEKQSKK